MPDAVDARRCPLCGASNACGMANGAASCWCKDIEIAESVLEQVPANARDKACICEACVASASATARPLKIVAGPR